jgi:hypothetical protein
MISAIVAPAMVFVPLSVDSIFRAIAPGVNETSGHADGLRNLVTFLALSALTAAILVYHLRYASRLKETPILSWESKDPDVTATEPPQDD